MTAAEPKDALKKRVAEVAEKYQAVISTMDHKELLDELESRALIASYSFQDPITAMMLKSSKAELLRRLKGGAVEPKEGEDAPGEEAPAPKEAKRPSLFG